MTIVIRPFVPEDAEACLRLFRDCVRRVNVRDYTPEQINAWASPDIDVATWARRFEGRFAYIACDGESNVGFTDMAVEGYLDRLFVSADRQRQGVARSLIERLIDHAQQQRIECLTTEASITAKPFFEAMGFVVTKQQLVECRGVSMTNFKMQRVFA